jgi:hypothetical protein
MGGLVWRPGNSWTDQMMAPSTRSFKASKDPRSSVFISGHHHEVPFCTKTLKDYHWPPMNANERRFQFMDTAPA